MYYCAVWNLLWLSQEPTVERSERSVKWTVAGMKGWGEQAVDSSRDFFWSEELLMTFVQCLMMEKKNPLVEKKSACITVESEAGSHSA